jgi:hypothetical protein
MLMECCSIEKIKYEIISYLPLKKKEMLEVKITNCPLLKGTYDLKIMKKEAGERE